MSPGDRSGHGAQWVFIGSTGSPLVNPGPGLILARLLMPAGFGMVAAVRVVAGGGTGQRRLAAERPRDRIEKRMAHGMSGPFPDARPSPTTIIRPENRQAR